MLVLGLAFGLTTVLAAALRTRPPRARVAIRGVDDAVELRRGRRLLVVNGDIRPQHVVDPAGSVVRLERPGAACAVRFERPGTYTLTAEGGPCLVPWIDGPSSVTTIRVTVH